MAKVTLVFEDVSDGVVNVRVKFDPPVKNKDDAMTPAQTLAMFALTVAQKQDAGREEQD